MWLFDDLAEEEGAAEGVGVVDVGAGVGVVLVEELDDVEAAAVDVEVDVALLEVGGQRLPHLYLGVQALHLAPGGIAGAAAVGVGVGEEQRELALAPLGVEGDDHSAHAALVGDDEVGLGTLGVEHLDDGAAGHHLAVLVEVRVALSELFERAVAERLLAVEDKPLAVLIPYGY